MRSLRTLRAWQPIEAIRCWRERGDCAVEANDASDAYEASDAVDTTVLEEALQANLTIRIESSTGPTTLQLDTADVAGMSVGDFTATALASAGVDDATFELTQTDDVLVTAGVGEVASAEALLADVQALLGDAEGVVSVAGLEELFVDPDEGGAGGQAAPYEQSPQCPLTFAPANASLDHDDHQPASRRRLRHQHFCRSGAWQVSSPYGSETVADPCRNAFLVRVVRTLCHARLANGKWDERCRSRKLGPGRRLSEVDTSGGLQPIDVAALPGVAAEVMCSRLEVRLRAVLRAAGALLVELE